MSPSSRRRFIENAVLAGLAVGPAAAVLGQEKPTVSPNDKLSVAVVGTGGRGTAHAREFAARSDCEVTYVCDADRGRAERVGKLIGERQGRAPKAVQDMREIFDDKSVDVVSTATCNHWHALCSIWAMQAGKDMYVEKPVSHNVSEGRRIVQAARKYNRICQTGTQNRSMGHIRAAMRYIHEGKLGEVKLGRVLVYRRRKSIGPPGNYAVPPGVDYNLWAGPAPMAPVTRKKFHYDWHWFWDFGNGELANNGIHYVDICRWAMQLEGLGRHVISYAGRFAWNDAGETPNTQITIHDFGEKTVVQEVRNLQTTPYRLRGGAVIFGSEGAIGISRAGSVLFDHDGKVVRGFKGAEENHFANFIKAVRSREPKDLRAEISEGHQSTALCHVGNISHCLGRTASPAAILKRLESLPVHEDVVETFGRVRKHLADNSVDVEKTPLTLGPWLKIDPEKETFADNPAADALLTRQYRKPFVVPEASEL